ANRPRADGAGRCACWPANWWNWGTPSASVRRPCDRRSKNELKPWLVKRWCIPPKANAEFVWRMEDVLETYKLPYDPRFPQVCMDEASKQLVGDVRPPQEGQPGQVRRLDSEYERKGTCNLFLFFEPLRGWRHVWVTDQRRKVEWAHCIKELLEVYYPEAAKVR